MAGELEMKQLKGHLICSLLIAALGLTGGCTSPCVPGRDMGGVPPFGDQFLRVAEGGGFQVWVREGTAPGNGEFGVFRGNEVLLVERHEDGDAGCVATSFFYQGAPLITVARDADGRIRSRTVWIRDPLAGVDMIYVDRNGDGRWDLMNDVAARVSYSWDGESWQVDRNGSLEPAPSSEEPRN